ncbi:hypothetical protein ACB094_11G017900 [Castanea mollissima]
MRFPCNYLFPTNLWNFLLLCTPCLWGHPNRERVMPASSFGSVQVIVARVHNPLPLLFTVIEFGLDLMGLVMESFDCVYGFV